jgi:endonuclease/exonuclease/phosphatase family metal-dependent hydrolase
MDFSKDSCDFLPHSKILLLRPFRVESYFGPPLQCLLSVTKSFSLIPSAMRRTRTKGGMSPIGLGSFTLIVSFIASINVSHSETFRVATYNLDNYLDAPTERRRSVKSEESKAKVRESILAIKPDVLALEEMGTLSAFQELRGSLKTNGLNFPNCEYVSGFDEDIHIAILSKFPLTSVRPQTNDYFLLNGKRFRVSRGFALVDVQVNTNYSFTLIAAHLKSKRPIASADEAELRHEEAKVLREKIDEAFAANPNINLVVLGDLNDYKNSDSVKAVIGRGKHKLVDTRPAERNGDTPVIRPRVDPPNVTWTHYYATEDVYSRLDYILLSPGMAREWVTNETYVLALPNWGKASDHRPVVATFEAEQK